MSKRCEHCRYAIWMAAPIITEVIKYAVNYGIMPSESTFMRIPTSYAVDVRVFRSELFEVLRG